MMKNNKEVTLETRETYFLLEKPQKLKIAENVLRNFFQKTYWRFFFFSVSRIALKNRNMARVRRNSTPGVSFKMG